MAARRRTTANRRKGSSGLPAWLLLLSGILIGLGVAAFLAFKGYFPEIQQNLARVDYSRNDLATPIAIQRCPTGAIVWLDMEKGPQKGSKAKHIVREEALPF